MRLWILLKLSNNGRNEDIPKEYLEPRYIVNTTAE